MSEMSTTPADVGVGTTVYDGEGNPIGTVRGLTDDGFQVTVAEGVAALSRGHVTAGQPGEAELTWRCLACGEVGTLAEEFPSQCPSCGARREELYYGTED